MFGKINYSFLLLGLLFGLTGCESSGFEQEEEPGQDTVFSLPYYNTPDFAPVWHPDNKNELHQIKNFSFQDQNGEDVTRSTFENKVYLANFFFYFLR